MAQKSKPVRQAKGADGKSKAAGKAAAAKNPVETKAAKAKAPTKAAAAPKLEVTRAKTERRAPPPLPPAEPKKSRVVSLIEKAKAALKKETVAKPEMKKAAVKPVAKAEAAPKPAPILKAEPKKSAKAEAKKEAPAKAEPKTRGRKISIDVNASEAAGSLSNKWLALNKKADQIESKPYNMKNVFEEKTAIVHKVLGWGYILANRNDRLEVLFKDGIKYLISNYKP